MRLTRHTPAYLRRALDARGMTTAELAREAGAPDSTVREAVNGRAIPERGLAERLVLALNARPGAPRCSYADLRAASVADLLESEQIQVLIVAKALDLMRHSL